MTRVYDLIAIARQFLYVREAQTIGQNRGLRVEAIQHWSGGASGDSWCVELGWMVYDICYQGQCPFDRAQNSESFRHLAVANGWVTKTPIPGDIVLSLTPEGIAHHFAILTVNAPLTTIAGNTSADGSSSNGDRVAEHQVSPDHKMYVHIP